MLQVSVTGVEGSVKVDCQLKGKAPDGLTVEGPQVNHSTQRFMQRLNGRITRSETINYQFSFAATASREGDFMVGPFEVTYDGKSHEVTGEIIQFGKLDNDPDMQIAFSLPRQSIYVGQEVPLSIRWSFAGDIDTVRHAFANLQIRSPLFDQFPFRDVPPTTRTTLTIATAKGGVEIDADVSQEKVDGRDFIVVTGTRTLLPDTPGQYSSIPITCRTRKVTQWGRDLFGDSRPRRDAPALAAGEPLNLTVKDVPLTDRPPSYSGAVGRGFSIDVSADRSVVRVGDPIALTITIRGDGNLERVSVPPLETNEGLSASLFQIPQEPVAGTVDDNQKQFSVNVRVKDQAVTQIPAIAFSWFDPYEERFATAVSKPIALQVRETQVISASDVVSSAAKNQPSSEADNRSSNPASSNAAALEMTFVGANLAIQRDPAQLLASSTVAATPRTIAVLCYALAGIALVGGVVARRRTMMDKAIVRRRKHLQAIRQQIETADGKPPHDAAAQIARALRDLIAELDPPDHAAVDRLIARCDNIIYATGTLNDTHWSDIVAQARKVVRETTVR